MLTPDQEKMREAAKAATPCGWEVEDYDHSNERAPSLCLSAPDYTVRIWVNSQAPSTGRQPQIGKPAWQKLAAQASANARYLELSSPAKVLALLDQVEAQGWQPIETAPKGVEVWAFNGEQVRMIYSEGPDWALWVFADDLLNDADPSPDQPTHYRLLPPPPEAA